MDVARRVPVSCDLSINVNRLWTKGLAGSLAEGSVLYSSSHCAISSTCGRRGPPDYRLVSKPEGVREGLVSPFAGRRRERARALVTEEVVAGEDVVHLEAIGAGIALAYVTLEERRVAHGFHALSVRQASLGDCAPARLAGTRRLHEEAERGSQGRSRHGAIMRVLSFPPRNGNSP